MAQASITPLVANTPENVNTLNNILLALQASVNSVDLTQLASGVVDRSTVSTLPVSPTNGQECFYLANSTNGVVWHLKYRAASASAYKWEFIGGAPLSNEVVTTDSTSSLTYAGMGSSGPSVALPLAGDYEVEVGAVMITTASTGCLMSYDIGGTGAVDGDAAVFAVPSGLYSTEARRTRVKTGLTAVTLLAKYRATTAGNATFANRRISVRPVRVG